ncbi:sigma-70 family RNA polymerase sigma factor [Streptomyces cocklensis]|uniref:ECF RNA polymerase sigma factor SigJ n=1 Tax=Actinacidiphila cocklensis TaxID=887465 RepID=A0A9W4GRJ6_9ACTN|nr:sigma-70 family RNA polymerase sigma factor [Actinacidiphila cocklensis]MDD1057573.1 sigma-70 family RNA polymerase sigma factor [Actinacidiphila cocklensis]WSX78910.1 sigma-70 family RNA polymerase sigma factor [Streptomyces sp. NBC_00899]CAG6393798.1 ECF RNA polymerase sigma factor SigJ [Actinacidiphila cocklensis]
MNDELLAERFEANRSHLRAVAYRMLGSATEADDAVQDAWLRLSRSDTAEVANLAGWLTTVVGRVCLDMLRSRRSRREEPLPAVPGPGAADPEQEAVLADSVGVAMLVVLETLDPAERLAFVLHDMFAVPFEDIAPIVDRTPAAARQLASRGRRRVQGAPVAPEPDLARQRQVVGAFLAAARQGDFEALVALLDPDAVSRTDVAGAPVSRGAVAVARNAALAATAVGAHLALVDGAVGIVAEPGTPRFRVLTFTIAAGRVRTIDVLTSPDVLTTLTVERLA